MVIGNNKTFVWPFPGFLEGIGVSLLFMSLWDDTLDYADKITHGGPLVAWNEGSLHWKDQPCH
jgi:hypothetical protein